MHELFELFYTFAKIGLFTFGGGYAMISLVEDICVEKKQWITHEEMMNLIVVAESTPGPIAINCATLVGSRQKGFWGALAATVGVALPSFAIIFALSKVLDSFLSIPLVAHAFMGIKAAVALLILQAGLRMLQKMPKNALSFIIAGLCIAALLAASLLSVRLSSIVLMLAAAAVSLGLYALRARRGGKA